ncbi:OmpP1/FadL family transporter [Synoicihabitans lomoniglobus]|uniref:Outer membrane protein transport protein n=1 Tax=Synoicihabitans lomoniglobus TaxID=2909285 RepID=A0AAF0CNV6_9BACT|nr:outer membrane protein transport protein [Opitutaceae bacterium LMO-M01]WED64925.1 outer membrane protein transport protein [Opitutaceae bacterium LMO-M01]
MSPSSRTLSLVAALTAFSFTPALFATNGMNMEGYGPVATAMGGASIAYDNGTAGVINNPATLSLMQEAARLDLALGVLGPDITATSPTGVPADSNATAFYMPAFGYTRQAGDFVYGFAVFGQGGMGCEYEPDSWRGLGFDLINRTEVSVGRAIIPLSYRVNERLNIGGTVDFVWAGMDLQMAMSGSQFFDLVNPMAQNFGHASGSLVQGFNQMMSTLPADTGVDYAYFNFTNDNDFTGEAEGYGFAGKIGLTYEVNEQVTFGLTYHSKTDLGDLDAPGNSLAFQLNVPGMGAMAQSLSGTINVNEFEWPALLGAGFAYRPRPDWLLVADVRQIFWANAMKQFSMKFTADDAATNGPFAGSVLDAVLYQDWDDQTVIQLGAAYMVNDRFTLRGGFNYGNNPVPDRFLNCLFPAIIETHFTGGFGYQFNDRSTIDVSVTYAPEVEIVSGYGVGVSHSQLNSQIMYSYRF